MTLNKRLISSEGVEPDPPLSAFIHSFEYQSGSTGSVTGLSFTPEMVIIIGDDNSNYAPPIVAFKNGANNQEFYYNNYLVTSGSSETNFSWGTDSFSIFHTDDTDITDGPQGGSRNNVAILFGAAGSFTTNNDGTDSCNVSKFVNAGFSIIEYTGTGSAMNIGHGLGQAPQHIFFVKTGETTGGPWGYESFVFDGSYYKPNIDGLYRGSFDAGGTTNVMTADASTISIPGGIGRTDNGANYIGFCMHEVSGVSDYRQVTGTNSTTQNNINVGFDPKWFISLAEDGTANNFSVHYLDKPQTQTPGSIYEFEEMYRITGGSKSGLGTGENLYLSWTNNRIELHTDNFKVNDTSDFVYITWGGQYMEGLTS